MHKILIGALASTLFAASHAGAQGFSSGSDGSDGALTFQANQGVVVFDPQALGLDADGDGVYHFTTITVPAGTTVRLGATKLGEGKPVVWLATGAIQIEGTIDLDGAAGHGSIGPATPSEAGAGGYNGGVSGSAPLPGGRAGSGPGGGAGTSGSLTCGGGAGHALTGTLNNSCGAPGVQYGNRFLLPVMGGSGGGGAKEAPSSGALTGGGGGGGGALLVASSDTITLNGSISAKGGNGGNSGAFGGGGGSGGSIRLMASTITGTGSLDVRGGLATSAGSEGRVRVEAFTRTGASTVTPARAAIFSRPGLVFPPANAPAVRVSQVGTVAVSTTPKGSFVSPDAVINASAPVPLTIVASNIPVGTTVRITISPENGAAFTVVSQALTGTLASSTATAGPVTIPHGFSRFHVLVTFTP